MLTEKQGAIRGRRRYFSRTTPNPVFMVLLTVLTVAMCSCGGKRAIPSEEIGKPTTLPKEQVLYKDATGLFNRIVGCFNRSESFAGIYEQLTWRSRQRLQAFGVRSGQTFSDWFENQRSSGKNPFCYSFRRVDILDIDIHDSTKAIVTASIVVEYNQQQFESVSSFFFHRERGMWKFPFADCEDFESCWWQKDKRFNLKPKEEGFANYHSSSTGLDFSYPLSWDITENARFTVPTLGIVNGLLLRYIDPVTEVIQTTLRCTVLPKASLYGFSAIDTSSPGPFVIAHREKANLKDQQDFSGKSYWILDRKNDRVVYLFGGVNTAVTSQESFNDIIASIVESITQVQK